MGAQRGHLSRVRLRDVDDVVRVRPAGVPDLPYHPRLQPFVALEAYDRTLGQRAEASVDRTRAIPQAAQTTLYFADPLRATVRVPVPQGQRPRRLASRWIAYPLLLDVRRSCGGRADEKSGRTDETHKAHWE